MDKQIPVGTLIDVVLIPPTAEDEICFSGRVVRLEATKEGKFEGAIQIVDINTQDRIHLAEFVSSLRKEEPEGDATGGEQ
jgi:hypothetical protein